MYPADPTDLGHLPPRNPLGIARSRAASVLCFMPHTAHVAHRASGDFILLTQPDIYVLTTMTKY